MKNNIVTVSETFTDNKSHNVRKNEETLYMENIESLLHLASYCGFNVKGQFNLNISISWKDHINRY